MGASLVSFFIAAFLGVSSASSVETTPMVETAPAISMESYDTVADGSSPEYSYPIITLSPEQYQRMLSGSFVQGSRSGSGLSVIIYSDFSCPYCQRLHDSDIPSHLRESFAGVPVKVVEKHFSVFGQEEPEKSARLAQCAGSLGGTDAYYRASDSLFRAYVGASEAGVSLTAGILVPPLAKQLGVSQKALRTCLDDTATATAVSSAHAEFFSLGFQGTPSVLIVDESTLRATAVTGAYPVDYFGAAVAMLLSGTGAR